MNIRKEREQYRAEGNGYYHLCTDGLKGELLFHNPGQFAFGMILMGIICIKYSLKIYAFTLMPNHIHIILSGTGANCLEAFDYLKRKLSARLKRDGFPSLPEDYWFKLTGISSLEQLRNEIVYVLRNPLEKGLAVVGGYPWSSGWLYHSGMGELLDCFPAKSLSKRELIKLLGGDDELPDNWLLHPYLGLHPGCFVNTSKVLELFPEPKDLQTALVKDYEAFFQIARRLGEMGDFNKSEIESIVSQTLQKRFSGRSLNDLSDEDKGKLALILNREFGLNAYQISLSIFVKEKTVRQLLGAKELR